MDSLAVLLVSGEVLHIFHNILAIAKALIEFSGPNALGKDIQG